MSRTSPRYGTTVRVGDCRVESHYLRFVADELRQYWRRKSALRDMEEGVIKATSQENNLGMPRGGEVSNPTHAAALRLMDVNEPTFKRRSHLRLWINSVDELLRKMPEEQQRILKMLYWDKRYTPLGVGLELNMHRATVYRHRDKALLTLAVHLIGEHILMPLSKDATK